MRNITVQYFAVLREQRGLSTESLLTDAVTPRELYERLRATHAFSLPADRVRAAINDNFADPESILREGTGWSSSRRWLAADPRLLVPMFEFRLSNESVDASECGSPLVDDGAGAYVTFEGWVRNRNEGKPVTALEYEAYVPLAEKEGQMILAEAQAQFPIRGARCVHRVGALELGELAVWVGVTAEHRGPAFEACRYIIDAVKSRVPIWKRERYADGTQTWINAAGPGAGPAPTAG